MKTAKTVGAVLGLIFVALIGVMAYYGYFSPLKVQETSVGPFYVIYEKHLGDYKDVAPIMDRIYQRLKAEEGIEATVGFGIYYDNPRNVKTEDLRSLAGCVLPDLDAGRIESLKSKYRMAQFPRASGYMIEFPYKGTLSYVIGPMKVYPMFTNYIAEGRIKPVPSLELYDVPNKRIQFFMATSLGDDFFQGLL